MRKISVWTESFRPEESIDILRTLALSHALEGGKLGQEVARLIRNCDLKALCDLEVDYSTEGHSAEQFRHVRQALGFFSKLRDLDIGVDKAQVGLETFLDSERRCRDTNALFRMRRLGEFQFSSRVEPVLDRARRKIAKVLGELPSLEQLGYRFGPGATTRTTKRDASIRSKLTDRLACSEDFIPYLKSVLAEMPALLEVHSILDRVDEDQVEWAVVNVAIDDAILRFVPKSAKTDRGIVVEPSLNSMFQLAVGDYMSRRLLRFGLDLRDQTVNQSLALEGSLTGALATLDLKSASDTISTELVYDLLPLDWAVFLARGRSSKVRLPSGETIKQEKFSSMGNGFTFPLESLIFWALATSSCPHGSTVSVYGDDIILPSSSFEDLSEVLLAVGFEVNRKKSFHKGPFRESCGKDYYRGTGIRPYYQKDWVSGRTLFTLHNHYVRTHDSERARLVESYIHPDLRIYGPDGYGDGHLLGEHPKRTKPSYTARGYSGYLFDTFTVKQRKDLRPKLPGDCVLPQYSIYRRDAETLFDFSDREIADAIQTIESESGVSYRVLPEEILIRKIRQVKGAPLPLAEFKSGEDTLKATSFPGEEGYKRISIYTLG